jgi:hypothetical protein
MNERHGEPLTSADAKPARLISTLAETATEILFEIEPGMI